MLTVSQLTKSYAGRVLFEDASLQINAGDRVGLIGPNGAGKSTLFSLILDESSPDAGKVSLEKNMTLGYLPQEANMIGRLSPKRNASSPVWRFARAISRGRQAP